MNISLHARPEPFEACNGEGGKFCILIHKGEEIRYEYDRYQGHGITIYFAFVGYGSKTNGCTSIGYGCREGDG